jgi:predicted anti-sigma-YlaC factor YlaD
MSRVQHPITPEELTAFVDGELSGREAALVAEHLTECSECADVVNASKRLSGQLAAWEIEAPLERIADGVHAVLREKSGPRLTLRPNRWTGRRAVVACLSGAMAALVLLAVAAEMDLFVAYKTALPQIEDSSLSVPSAAAPTQGGAFREARARPQGRKASKANRANRGSAFRFPSRSPW